MKKEVFHSYFIIVLGILALFHSKLNAQDTTEYLYSIHVMQSFSSWGNCSSDPDFDYADIYLICGSRIIDTKHITTANILQRHDFEGIFKNNNQNKDLKFLKESDDPLIKILVHTNANDIENDHDLYYELDTNELVVGEYAESHEASDPCNNFISSNREGYTMTTRVYIDDPVFVSITGTDDNSYNLDYERVAIKFDRFYENGKGSPQLQVKPYSSNDSKWESLPTSVIIEPYKTVYLSYEDIAGKKSNNDSHFYEWIGKPLHFRVVKTLLNDEKTTGGISEEVKFYPDGLQYTIEEIKRTYCNNDVRVYVELENSADQGYFNLNTDFFYWSVYDGRLAFHCEMVHIDGLKYEIIADPGALPDDPFDEANTDDIVWTLQLIDATNESSYACERTFTIPVKPEKITIDQKLNIHNVNGTDYNLPSMNNPYVMLDIVDPYELSALRRPYIITDGIDFNVSIEEIPTPYGELSEEEQIANNVEFESYFKEMVELESNPYKNYFNAKYKEWFFDQNPTSPLYQINHPSGRSQFSIKQYHTHYHTHSCTHTHTHTHTCLCTGKSSPVKPEEGTKNVPNCDLICTGHNLNNPDPHNLCDNGHSHVIDSDPDHSYIESHSHTHTASHNHTHSHTSVKLSVI